jgi:hypothetical protein
LTATPKMHPRNLGRIKKLATQVNLGLPQGRSRGTLGGRPLARLTPRQPTWERIPKARVAPDRGWPRSGHWPFPARTAAVGQRALPARLRSIPASGRRCTACKAELSVSVTTLRRTRPSNRELDDLRT